MTYEIFKRDPYGHTRPIDTFFALLTLRDVQLYICKTTVAISNGQTLVDIGLLSNGEGENTSAIPQAPELLLTVSKLSPSVRPALMMPETVRSLDIQPDLAVVVKTPSDLVGVDAKLSKFYSSSVFTSITDAVLALLVLFNLAIGGVMG